MRLNVDLRPLERVARRMGSQARLDIDVRRGLDPIDPVDIQLKEGIEIDLDDVEISMRGLLSYKGRQVVLYIQDQGWRIQEVLAGRPDEGKKVHVADCRTLQDMRRRGRYERYVATNDVSGDFYVTGQDSYGAGQEGRGRLLVCQNCLRKLGFSGNLKAKARQFDWSEFFEEYEPHFAQLPKRKAGEFDGAYTPTWAGASRQYREQCGYRCEGCAVDLSNDAELLHVHHINGVKSDNRPSNLRALCVECHSREPGHEHMRANREEVYRVSRLRRQQRWS